MESRELIERRQLTEIRRVLVSITDKGRTFICAARPVHARAVHSVVLDHLETSEADVILKVSARLSAQAIT